MATPEGAVLEALKQRAIAMGKRNTKHGAARHSNGLKPSPEYNSWIAMIKRCELKTHQAYHRYGGLGIIICPRWRGSFENFLADMGPRPPGTSLDRFPDKNGNYEPGNCRWATQHQQMANARSNVMITIRGITKSLPDWALESGVPWNVVRQRISHGWEPERAVFTPKCAAGSVERHIAAKKARATQLAKI